MNLSWDAVIQGTITGLVGAVVFWTIGMIRDGIRNFWLCRSIRRQLRFVSCGRCLQGLTTSIHNHLQIPFRVRDVSLFTERGNFAFNATGEVSSSGIPLPFKVTRDIKRRLKRGEEVQISTKVAYRSPYVEQGHAGFVEVKPFTQQHFLLPAELTADMNWSPQHLQITVEYETWTKKTRTLVQCSEGWALNHMKKVVSTARNELLDGTLNKARLLFRLSPISVPAVTVEKGTADTAI